MWGQPAGSKKFVYTSNKVIKYILHLFIWAKDFFFFFIVKLDPMYVRYHFTFISIVLAIFL